jgi:cytidylate kinase
LPQAPVKVFLTASLDARVERRLAELAARGSVVEVSELRAQMAERDALDQNRHVAPLRPATDALVIDSTDLGIEEVVDLIAGAVEALRR